jgi:hypothetical protein
MKRGCMSEGTCRYVQAGLHMRARLRVQIGYKFICMCKWATNPFACANRLQIHSRLQIGGLVPSSALARADRWACARECACSRLANARVPVATDSLDYVEPISSQFVANLYLQILSPEPA